MYIICTVYVVYTWHSTIIQYHDVQYIYTVKCTYLLNDNCIVPRDGCTHDASKLSVIMKSDVLVFRCVQ